MRHESELQPAALAHWRSSSDQLSGSNLQDDFFADDLQPVKFDSTLPLDMVAVQRKIQRSPAVTRQDIPSITPEGPSTSGEIRNYRRPKSMTLTNLLARSQALLKA